MVASKAKQIMSLLGAGSAPTDIARHLGVHVNYISTVKRRYAGGGKTGE